MIWTLTRGSSSQHRGFVLCTRACQLSCLARGLNEPSGWISVMNDTWDRNPADGRVSSVSFPVQVNHVPSFSRSLDSKAKRRMWFEWDARVIYLAIKAQNTSENIAAWQKQRSVLLQLSIMLCACSPSDAQTTQTVTFLSTNGFLRRFFANMLLVWRPLACRATATSNVRDKFTDKRSVPSCQCQCQSRFLATWRASYWRSLLSTARPLFAPNG